MLVTQHLGGPLRQCLWRREGVRQSCAGRASRPGTRRRGSVQRDVVARHRQVADRSQRLGAHTTGFGTTEDPRHPVPLSLFIPVDVGLGLNHIALERCLCAPSLALGVVHPVFVGVATGLDLRFHFFAGLQRSFNDGVGLGRVGLKELIQPRLRPLEDVHGQRCDARPERVGERLAQVADVVHQRGPGKTDIELATGVVQAQIGSQADLDGDRGLVVGQPTR